MYSRAVGYKADGSAWSVIHDCNADEDLQVEGNPPAPFAAIAAELRAKQEETTEWVDYVFDVPMELVKALSGYRCDRDFELGPEPEFTPLQRKRTAPVLKSGPGFFARLFGKR